MLKLDCEGCIKFTWWRHQMETFSALLVICAGNSHVTGEFPAQRPVTRSFDVFFDPRLNKRLNKYSWGWWFETPSRPLWRQCNELSWWRNVYKCICIHIHYHQLMDFEKIMLVNKIWWLCLIPTSTTRFAGDLRCRMAKSLIALY